MNIKMAQEVDCLCDFTYDFYWQHEGSRLEPGSIIPGQAGTSFTYEDLVSCLKKGEDVIIDGNAGKRLGSSLGVDLKFFGGTGSALNTGSIIVNGDVGTRMGISMLSGAIYVSGNVEQPLGNVVEVHSEREGYRKYLSITSLLQDCQGDEIVHPNVLEEDCLVLKDGIIRDTVAARLNNEKKVIVEGNAGMSTGILMESGFVEVKGNAGMNTGVLLRGGTVIVRNTDEFAGSYMKGGTLLIGGKTKGYVGVKMKGGIIFSKGEALAKAGSIDGKDISMLVKTLGISQIEAMMYKKYGN